MIISYEPHSQFRKGHTAVRIRQRKEVFGKILKTAANSRQPLLFDQDGKIQQVQARFRKKGRDTRRYNPGYLGSKVDALSYRSNRHYPAGHRSDELKRLRLETIAQIALVT